MAEKQDQLAVQVGQCTVPLLNINLCIATLNLGYYIVLTGWRTTATCVVDLSIRMKDFDGLKLTVNKQCHVVEERAHTKCASSTVTTGTSTGRNMVGECTKQPVSPKT